MSETINTSALERARRIRALGPACAKVFSMVLQDLTLDKAARERIIQKSSDPETLGVRRVYYTGLNVWTAAREELPRHNVAAHFTAAEQKIIRDYTFLGTPERMANAYLQSALSGPTTFMAWLSEARGVCRPGVGRRRHYDGLSVVEANDALHQPYFSEMLRQGSVTSTGLYRNSTGLTLSAQSYLVRSAARPAQAFRAEYPGESGPVILISDEEAALSPSFVGFLYQRMRDHNSNVRQNPTGKDLHEGTSAGCPVAHIGLTQPEEMGFDVDPYRLTCDILAASLPND